jgi:hypothetical protein
MGIQATYCRASELIYIVDDLNNVSKHLTGRECLQLHDFDTLYIQALYPFVL